MELFYKSSTYTPEKDIKDMTIEEFTESLGENKIAFQTAENGWYNTASPRSLIANEEGGVELLNENARR